MQATERLKERAAVWFRQLRDGLCTELERIEDEQTFPLGDRAAGRFARKPWSREGGGGGEISVMKGRVFEKVGVNISTVHGRFTDTMRKEMPDGATHPNFWASGISVVAHPQSPRVPAVHMNTRFLVTSPEDGDTATPVKTWFGGGADLTPMFPDAADAADFHAALKACCDISSPEYYVRYKAWCDEYFFLKHRDEPRGDGGIFYDYLNTGDFEADFAFTRRVGETFSAIYPALVRRHVQKAWSDEERAHQLLKRGRYVEFNLLYDRGTRFGLMTGGNVEAILMSLPPEARWA